MANKTTTVPGLTEYSIALHSIRPVGPDIFGFIGCKARGHFLWLAGNLPQNGHWGPPASPLRAAPVYTQNAP
jgi:hypothetical protein